MRVHTTGDPAEFKAAAFPFLQADPVLNTVLLTNTEDRIRGILHDPAPPVFLTVHEDDEVVGAVVCTALRGIMLGALPEALVPPIVDACAELAPDPNAVEGTASAALLLAELLAARNGRAVRRKRGTRLHRLEEFVEQKAEGAPRLAVEADAEVLIPQFSAYGQELGHVLDHEQEEKWVRARIALDRIWAWENDGRIVSLVGHQRAVFGATRVGPVYTPPADAATDTPAPSPRMSPNTSSRPAPRPACSPTWRTPPPTRSTPPSATARSPTSSAMR